MFTLSVSKLLIVAPIIIAQYALAIAGLILLAKREPSKTEYLIWNLVIVLVFFVGSITFFIYNAVRPPQAANKADAGKESASETQAVGEDAIEPNGDEKQEEKDGEPGQNDTIEESENEQIGE